MGGTEIGVALQNSRVSNSLNVTELSTDVDAALSLPPGPVAAPEGSDSTTDPVVVIPVTNAV